jgi:hypothetical protein
MTENKMRDKYRFILPVRASHFRSMSKIISIPRDLGHRCNWRTCHSRRGILDALRKLHRKILGCAASHFRSMSKTVSIPGDLGHRCNWRTCHSRHGILDTSKKLHKKFSVALGFLSGVIAFLSSLIVTMTWLHCSAPMGLNVNVSSFLLMFSFMIPATTSIVAPAVLKNGLPKKSGI